MRDKYFYEVMFDDTSIDVSKEVGIGLVHCQLPPWCLYLG